MGADKMSIIKDYKAKIENELCEICNDILGIIEESLIPNSTSEEAKVFYYKMKGDYHRYLSEFQTGDTRKESAGSALVLPSTSPSSTTRFSTLLTRPARLPRQPSTMLLPSSIPSTKNPTRTLPSSCSFSVITSHCGRATRPMPMVPIRQKKSKKGNKL